MDLAPQKDLSRFCIHTMTTRQWTLEECARHYAACGAKGITVWRNTLAGIGAAAAGRLVRDLGLSVTSLCRGGFFVADSPARRQEALDENRRCIDEAAAIGAPHIVLVCGAVPGIGLAEARLQTAEALAAILPHAESSGVRLAVEPLHPMYAGDRSAVNTLGQARAICAEVGSPWVGVALDVYHTWWDERLEHEVRECGREGRLFAFHVSDWLTPTVDLLEDRGLMGEGCIPIRRIRGWVDAAGFGGMIEVEIFSRRLWEGDPHEYLERIRSAYLAHA